jgi:pyrophosphatase PpaX
VTFETFLFDLDGTLIDSIELILSSYRHTMMTHRGSVPPDALWLEGLGTPVRVQFRGFTDDPDEIDAFVATYRAHNQRHHDRLIREYPGVSDAVRALRERGARLAVVTSKLRAAAERGLHCCGMLHLFEVLVCADDVIPCTIWRQDGRPACRSPQRCGGRSLGPPSRRTRQITGWPSRET